MPAPARRDYRRPVGAGAEEELERLRALVAETDRVLVETLNERLRIVDRIKQHKAEHELPFLDPDREAWLLAYLARTNRGPLSPDGLERFVQHVLELTKAELASLQNPQATAADRA